MASHRTCVACGATRSELFMAYGAGQWRCTIELGGGRSFVRCPEVQDPLIAGTRYHVRYRAPNQRRSRTAVMDFVAVDRANLVFSARPVAGTQSIPGAWVRSVKAVPIDTPVHINRVLPEIRHA
jgi:hypothetical protein